MKVLQSFHKYRPFVRSGIQSMVAYRVDFLFYRLGDLMGAIVTYFLWQAVFLSSPHQRLNGFSVQEMSLYIFLSFFTSQLSYSSGSGTIGDEVKDGSIAMRLLKPVDFNLTYLFDEIGHKLISISLLAIPLFGGVLLYQLLHASVSPFRLGNLLLFLLSSLLAYFLNFYFNVCYGFAAFIFKNLWGMNVMKAAVIAFMSGSLIPLAFFPESVARVLQYLPFASLIYTPVMIYLGKENIGQILAAFATQIAWLLVFIGLSKVIWKITIKHLSVQGG